MKKNVCISVTVLTLAACGGGSGGDPSAYKPTTAGSGSTLGNAETAQGTIRYAQYQAGGTVMFDKSFSVPSVNAAVNFNPVSKMGSIQFPVMGVNELITTNDGYATTSWTGPFLTGQYKFNGNILMGCNLSAPIANEQTQIFVSSNMSRVQNGLVDDLNGQSFDLYDCPMLQKNQIGSLKINADGSLFLSTANVTIPKNQVFNMLNPEAGYGGALINEGPASTKGNYSGHAFKYGINGVTKYAIAIQTSSNNLANVSSYHYLLAIQR